MPVNVGGEWPLYMAMSSKLPARYWFVDPQYWPTLETFQVLWEHGPKDVLMSNGNAMAINNNNNNNSSYTTTTTTASASRNYHKWTPLEWAIYTQQSLDIQAFFVQQFLLHYNKHQKRGLFQIDLGCPALEEEATQQVFGSQHGATIAPVFAYVECLDIFLGNKNSGDQQKIHPHGWKILLRSLWEPSPSILTHIRIKDLSSNLEQQVGYAFSQFLANNHTLQDLNLSSSATASSTIPPPRTGSNAQGDTDDGADCSHHNHILRYIAQGIQTNPGSVLQSLTLQQFDIPDSHTICHLLRENVTLQSINLQGVRMECDWKDIDHHRDWRPSSRIRKVTLNTTTINSLYLQGLLSKLEALPSLTDLSMWIKYHDDPDNSTTRSKTCSFDLTTCLARILQQNRLQRWFITCKEKQGPACDRHRQIDLSRLCETALNSNTSLQQWTFSGVPDLHKGHISALLDTLQHHNATLTQIPFTLWKIPAEQDSIEMELLLEKITYWLQLKRDEPKPVIQVRARQN